MSSADFLLIGAIDPATTRLHVAAYAIAEIEVNGERHGLW